MKKLLIVLMGGVLLMGSRGCDAWNWSFWEYVMPETLGGQPAEVLDRYDIIEEEVKEYYQTNYRFLKDRTKSAKKSALSYEKKTIETEEELKKKYPDAADKIDELKSEKDEAAKKIDYVSLTVADKIKEGKGLKPLEQNIYYRHRIQLASEYRGHEEKIRLYKEHLEELEKIKKEEAIFEKEGAEEAIFRARQQKAPETPKPTFWQKLLSYVPEFKWDRSSSSSEEYEWDEEEDLTPEQEAELDEEGAEEEAIYRARQEEAVDVDEIGSEEEAIWKSRQ